MRRMSRRVTGWVVFLFALALLSSGVSDRPQALAGGSRAAYFPKVTLQTQDNKNVRFYDLIKGKIVVINFMYTRCDGKL
jgi:cytochrome oxidase Cu insertion factor (SCO1/SenC/PrrC family)